MQKRIERSRPLHVLDIACGQGVVRVAVARRVLAREIHYTGIDNVRSQLESIVSLLSPRAKLIAAKDHVGCDPAVAIGAQVCAMQRRIRERFIRAVLDLHDPLKLASQLSGLLGNERFDEIHVHLLHPRTDGWHARGPLVLRTIAEYLRPGARLYHLFQNSSPLFDFRPERSPASPPPVCPAVGTRGDVIGREEARFREGASQGGLVLDKCGRTWELRRSRAAGETEGRRHSVWLTRRFAGTEPHRHTADVYAWLAQQYSAYSRFATHFVILRKAKRTERRRRRTKRSSRNSG